MDHDKLIALFVAGEATVAQKALVSELKQSNKGFAEELNRQLQMDLVLQKDYKSLLEAIESAPPMPEVLKIRLANV